MTSIHRLKTLKRRRVSTGRDPGYASAQKNCTETVQGLETLE